MKKGFYLEFDVGGSERGYVKLYGSESRRIFATKKDADDFIAKTSMETRNPTLVNIQTECVSKRHPNAEILFIGERCPLCEMLYWPDIFR